MPYDDILSGGPPKDGIPIQILTWHEIVNDTIGGVPVTVTFCPLCNTGIAFERTFDGQVLDLSTTGRLRFSNLIMYDRQTETWWQQATGEAIAGEYAGQQLTFVPASMVSWADFRAAHPDGMVLSRDTGHNRNYVGNAFLFGIAYAAGSLSCTLPIFLVVVGTSLAGEGPLASFGQFIGYALGMGTVIIAVTLGAALFRRAMGRWMRLVTTYVHRVSAMFVIGAGAYLVYYWVFQAGRFFRVI